MRASLPPLFVASCRESLACALDDSPSVSVRLNPAKPFCSQWSDVVGWCGDGRYIDSRPSFTLDPLFAAGAYYVQEASSMVVGAIVSRLELGHSPVVLDLCAAPGGKTTHISSVVGGGGVVIANEVIRARAGVLAQNVVRWGDGNTVVTSADAAVFGAMGGVCDVVVVDAPCSGEGMFRKDDSARQEWSPSAVELCAARQRRILSDAMPVLRDGGYLIYSTCTFNETENERNVEWLLKSGRWQSCNSMLEGVVDSADLSELGAHFYPDRVRGEGFFVSVLRKTGEESPLRQSKPMRVKSFKVSPLSEVPLYEVEQGGRLWGYSQAMVGVVELLRAGRVPMLMAGVELGEMIRGELLKPAHALAQYAHLVRDRFAVSDLSREQALDYLRKNTLDSSSMVEGLQVVAFEGLALGFAKRIGSRVNNMYPTAWRILMV